MTDREKKLLVSIVTPTLNSERYIADNIKSVLSQTYPHIEHVFIDGVSSDRTLSRIAELDPKARVLSESDNGISDAFNKGIKMSKGDIIAILNSDDYYIDNTVIEKVVGIMESKGIKSLYGKIRAIDPASEAVLFVAGRSYSKDALRREYIIHHPAFFARREVYKKTGEFSLDYRIAMDYDFFLRSVEWYEPFFVNEEFTVFRLGGASSKQAWRAQKENYMLKRKNGIGICLCVLDFIYGYFSMLLSVGLRKAGIPGLLVSLRKLRVRS